MIFRLGDEGISVVEVVHSKCPLSNRVIVVVVPNNLTGVGAVNVVFPTIGTNPRSGKRVERVASRLRC